MHLHYGGNYCVLNPSDGFIFSEKPVHFDWPAWLYVYAIRQHRDIQRSKLTHIITLGICLVLKLTITTTTTDHYLYFLKFYGILQGNMILKRVLTFFFPILSQPLIMISHFCNSTLNDISRPNALSIHNSYSITPKYM